MMWSGGITAAVSERVGGGMSKMVAGYRISRRTGQSLKGASKMQRRQHGGYQARPAAKNSQVGGIPESTHADGSRHCWHGFQTPEDTGLYCCQAGCGKEILNRRAVG